MNTHQAGIEFLGESILRGLSRQFPGSSKSFGCCQKIILRRISVDDSLHSMSSSADVSPSATPSSTPLSSTHAPKYGTVIPNRIFVGGIAANTSEQELKQFFAAYGAVKDSKIIADRAGVSKG
uniref:Protein boule n=1 Tax=Magallana gigas TaxID=29159 RepID=K1QWP6_MAGGI